MDEIIKIQERYYILATSSRADERTLVLKHGETFAIFDHYGDVVPFGLGEQGLYHEGTRHVSRLELRLAGHRPLLLSSTVKEENELLTVDLTNPDLVVEGTMLVPRDMLHVFRGKFLWEGVCYERWRITNHGGEPSTFVLELTFEADFADIFEVRGVRRAGHGRPRPPRVERQSVLLAYEGLDRVVRSTRLSFSEPPGALTGSSARFDLSLGPGTSHEILLAVACGDHADPGEYEPAFHRAVAVLQAAKRRRADVFTSNEQFNDWLNRSTADLHMMVTELPEGPYPYAGVPWFSTPFGRDGLITALELLWIWPALARGVLANLAVLQAEAEDPARDAEPGKILHEMRKGEMAALGEVPFGRYYGSADATPLFVLLAGAYYRRTGDRAFVERLWPHVERALDWIDRYGDVDGDGFVEYRRHTAEGLVHQGWKDSGDAVSLDDGRLAEPPIALCEVQAYVYAARMRASELAMLLGRTTRAAELARQAAALAERFEQAFWSEELGTYVLALDGQKRPCRVRASNAGHCLLSGIVSPARAAAVAQCLLGADCYSGWGIRTLASSERRYNPMAYHNGSIWPHDNALIAAGMARYGLTDQAARVMEGFFDASLFIDLRRMPELFCGFRRRPGGGPTRYPVACAPQAWVAGAVFMLLEAALGLSIDAPARRVVFSRAVLPPFLQSVRIENLEVGPASLNLRLERHEHDVGIQVLRRTGDVEIVSIK